MKTTIRELKKIVKNIICEIMSIDPTSQTFHADIINPDAPTISADIDPSEKNFEKQFPKWGNPKASPSKLESPAAIKSKQVKKILKDRGYTTDAKNMKAITMWLDKFIETMYPDHKELFLTEPEDIADDFVKKFLTH